MKKIIYFHGFGSAGSTGTATIMRNLLYEKDVRVLSPDIPTSPQTALQFLKDFVAQEQPDLIIGTSMGGMYAEQMRGYKRILVNPSFHMARLLTFRGLGNYDFQNKREDGATRFKVDKQMIAEFKEVEKLSFKGLTPEDKKNVYGLFGRNDQTVHTQDDYTKVYGKEHFIIFEGEHRLNDKVLKHDVLPVIEEILFP